MRPCDPPSNCYAGSSSLPEQRLQAERCNEYRRAEPRHGRAAIQMYETDGELEMAAIETFAQRAKRELDLQLDEELEGTFPASDPPKITRFSAKPRGVAERKSATAPKDDS